MNISFTGHNMDVTDSLRSLCEKKFETLGNHIDNIQNVSITLTVDKLTQIAEATVTVPKHEFYAKAESDDMYKSIDELLDKIHKQAIKNKEKTKGHKHEKKLRNRRDKVIAVA
jgi:putative sigma-54 modulation protein